MNKDILAQKEADVIALSEKMEAASSVVLVEYRGLSVKEVTELRRASVSYTHLTLPTTERV